MTTRTGGSMPAPTPAVARQSLQGHYAGFASRFAALYFLSGIGGSVLSFSTGQVLTPAAGASGGGSGMM